MKIIIGLLIVIVISLVLGPIAGFIGAIGFVCFFIPGVGQVIGSMILIGGAVALFGLQATLIAIPVLMLALYLYSQYELKKVLEPKNTLTASTNTSVNAQMQKSDKLFKQLSIKNNCLVSDDNIYPLGKVNIKWLQGHTHVFFNGKIAGTSIMTANEFNQLNNDISKYEKEMKIAMITNK
jgi:hypothetical protein